MLADSQCRTAKCKDKPYKLTQLRALMQRHRSKVRGVSRDAEFLRWLMDREWSRLEAGSGYSQSPGSMVTLPNLGRRGPESDGENG